MRKLEKQAIVSSIIEKLDLGDEQTSVLSENLNKMSKPSLIGLATAITDKIELYREDAPPDSGDLPYTPVPLNLVPADVKLPKKADDMSDQLKMLPVVSDRLAYEFGRGEFPGIKRNIGIIECIVANCRRIIAKQLWDSVNVYKGIPVDESLSDEEA